LENGWIEAGTVLHWLDKPALGLGLGRYAASLAPSFLALAGRARLR